MTTHRLAIAASMLALLAACTTAPYPTTEPPALAPSLRAGEPVPTPSSTREPLGPARDVPVTSSSLRDRSPERTGPRPVAVEVPGFDARVDVEPVGVADDGQMEIPAFAETAGWYRFGASPGDARGTVVIAAHVDSIASAGLGPFAALQDASTGDEIEVRLEDGSTATYVVEDVDRRTKEGIDWEEVFVRDGPARLVLVTCGGRYLRELGRYEDNVLVTAVPLAARR